jgi:outer membrane protein assembly factor BamB
MRTTVWFLAALAWLLPNWPLHSQDVLTWHNDNARTGQNLEEKILTLQNVNPRTFGKLFILHVDGKVDAEPLYAAGREIPGKGLRNVLYVATEHASVYAFDADTGTAFWHVSLLKHGEVPSDNHSCDQVTPEIGITSTPVIDLHRGPHGVLYAVTMSKDRSEHYMQRFHALDLQTGGEEFGGPIDIHATIPETGTAGASTTRQDRIFDPQQYEERAALLLLNGVVYTSWASHCDFDPYNGWIIGYSAATLQQTAALNITPNGKEGAIWQSGAGPAADPDGYIYVLAANGTFDTKLNSKGFPARGDFGNAFLKISTQHGRLSVADYFAMSNVVAENAADGDLGSGGPVVLPEMTDAAGQTRHLAVGAGKDRNIYLVDRHAMGHFDPHGNSSIYQELPEALRGRLWDGEHGAPAYFDHRLYYGAMEQPMRDFRFLHARLLAKPSGQTALSFVYPGTTPSISADGTRNGIVWAVENRDPVVLHAYDANDLSHELYNSHQAPSWKDYVGSGNKFITPMIAHGKVYVGTTDGVGVFGLLPNSGSHR